MIKLPLRYDEYTDGIIGNILLRTGNAESLFGIPTTLFEGKFFILYNLFSLAFDRIGLNTNLAIRLPALIFSILSLIFQFLITRKLFNSKTALLSLLLFSVFPFTLLSGAMGLRLSFVTLAFLSSFYLVLITQEARSPRIHLFTGIYLGFSAIYFHPLCIQIIPAAFVLLFLTKNRNRITYAGIGIVISALPAIIFYLENNLLYAQTYKLISNKAPLFSHQYFSQVGFNLKTAVYYLFFDSQVPLIHSPALNGPLFLNPLVILLIGSVILLGTRKHLDNITKDKKYSLLVVFSWIMIGISVPALSASILEPRYLLPVIPPLIILVSASICLMKRQFAVPLSIVFVFYLFLILYFYDTNREKDPGEWFAEAKGMIEIKNKILEKNSLDEIIVFDDEMLPMANAFLNEISISNSNKELPVVLAEHFPTDYSRFDSIQSWSEFSFLTRQLKLGAFGNEISKKKYYEIFNRLLTHKKAIYFVIWSRFIKTSSPTNSLFKTGYISLKPFHRDLVPIYTTFLPNGEVGIELYRLDNGNFKY